MTEEQGALQNLFRVSLVAFALHGSRRFLNAPTSPYGSVPHSAGDCAGREQSDGCPSELEETTNKMQAAGRSTQEGDHSQHRGAAKLW